MRNIVLSTVKCGKIVQNTMRDSFIKPPRVAAPPETAFTTSYVARSIECDPEGFLRLSAIFEDSLPTF